MIDVNYVVWDFDGVVNRNIVDGRFVWADNLEADLGISIQPFAKFIFNDDFDEIICGRKDLLARIEEWVVQSGTGDSPLEILDYWFEMDARPDENVLSIMDDVARSGVKNVIATNNEDRRASYIENEMGFRDRVEVVFSSGRMKCMKPNKEFFDHVANSLNVEPDRLFLIDDNSANIESAASLGWRTHYFENTDYEHLRQNLELNSGA